MALRARLVGFMIYPCPSCCFDTIALIPDALVRSHLGCYRVLGMLCFSMIREASLSCNVVFCLCIISEACLVISISKNLSIQSTSQKDLGMHSSRLQHN